MLRWLNANAAAVQAAAAVGSVLVTILLAFITLQYVRLTQELARAARQQLRFQEQSAASAAAQLITQIVFLDCVRRFPPEDLEGDRVRDVPLWKHGDVSALGSLAASVLGARAPVQEVIQALNWIHGKAEDAGQTRGPLGHDFPWEQWRRELQRASGGLRSLKSAAEAARASMGS